MTDCPNCKRRCLLALEKEYRLKHGVSVLMVTVPVWNCSVCDIDWMDRAAEEVFRLAVDDYRSGVR
jgi:C4-type Zn-finger protein